MRLRASLQLTVLFILLTALRAWSAPQVAFIEVRNHKGDLVRLEPGGRFAHVAIRYRGLWLHTHPFRGTELTTTKEIEKIGRIIEVIEAKGFPDLNPKMVEGLLGRPYDSEFSWDDERLYCSELVAKLLLIAPRPMYFDPKLWPEKYWRRNGEPGQSPDSLYLMMAKRR